MATATLPYPDMDFVPLDILTAAEMDQMVANDQYLAQFANGLADGSNLSDGVILARHLNYNTFPLTKYSTTPQAIGITDDGDTVYRAVVNYTSQTTLMSWSGALLTGIKSILNIHGWYVVDGSKYDLPRGEVSASGGVESISYYVDGSGNLHEKHNFAYASGREAHLIVEYTAL